MASPIRTSSRVKATLYSISGVGLHLFLHVQIIFTIIKICKVKSISISHYRVFSSEEESVFLICSKLITKTPCLICM